jgi:hypothetical protein
MQHLVKIALVHLMLVSGLAARDQAAIPGKPVTITSEALEIIFNDNVCPEQALARPRDEPVKFCTSLPATSARCTNSSPKPFQTTP